MTDKIDLIKAPEQSPENSSQDSIELSNVGSFIGEAFDSDESINYINSFSKPEITVLVGFEGYGKTSFVASCYHKLLTEGKVGDYIFYDSDTLTGFERRIYLRRLSSLDDDIPSQTRRTIRGEPYLLTLRFSHPVKGEKVVVISDRSGETYKSYIDYKSKLNSDILLRSADRILLFVDCEKLISGDRLQMEFQYGQLIDNMREMGSLKDDVKIHMIYNKIDLTQGKEDLYKEEKDQFLNNLSEKIGIPIGDCYEIVSNDMNQSRNAEKLLLDIVNGSDFEEQTPFDFSELDWVKTMLK